MVPGDARPPRLPHLLRPRRPRSAFVPSADASRGCSFSSLLQKVPLGVGAALPAISSRVVCSPITQQTPAIARGALASMAHVLGQVSLPYGAGPLATPTAAHEDASDGLHHGSPRSTLDAVRESFLKIWIKSCDFLLEIFHWFFSLLVKNSKLPWHQSSCPLCLCPCHASCPVCHPVCLGLPLGALGVCENPPLANPADIQAGQGAGALSSSLIAESQSKPSIRKHVGL